MTSYIRNPLTIVWALLTLVTAVSWLTARDGGAAHVVNPTVTVVVLLIAAVKAQLVIWHFMEVRRAPRVAAGDHERVGWSALRPAARLLLRGV